MNKRVITTFFALSIALCMNTSDAKLPHPCLPFIAGLFATTLYFEVLKEPTDKPDKLDKMYKTGKKICILIAGLAKIASLAKTIEPFGLNDNWAWLLQYLLPITLPFESESLVLSSCPSVELATAI